MTLSNIMLLSSEAATAVANEDAGRVYSISEALMVALFTIVVVFCVLALICIFIKIFSAVISLFEKGSAKKDTPSVAAPAETTVEASAEEEFSSGTLKLKGCDEKTAAMIMAIVSDNTGIPLSELVFKRITLVEKK